MKKRLRDSTLHTVCESAKCPNISECFGNKTATFMIMGDICTRNCGFCAVEHGIPKMPDPDEPRKIAEMVAALELRHVVVTSVTRDDLWDGGASHFLAVIHAIKGAANRPSVEVLTPDFNGDFKAIKCVLDAGPDVFNHNLETVKRLSPVIRSRADYERSLSVLEFVRNSSKSILLKSGIMVGLGEDDSEVYKTLDDLALRGCDIVTIGQYLCPSRANLEVKRYVEVALFNRYKEYGLSIGLKYVFSGPLVRSSYMAEKILRSLNNMQFPIPPFREAVAEGVTKAVIPAKAGIQLI